MELTAYNLVHLDRLEGRRVFALLRKRGYRWLRGPCQDAHRALWTPDGKRCVGEAGEGLGAHHYLEPCVLADILDVPGAALVYQQWLKRQTDGPRSYRSWT